MTLPISIIGALQRSAPQLTSLWLEWTGIPNFELCTFEVAKGGTAVRPSQGAESDHGHGPSGPLTTIILPAGIDAAVTWKSIYDVLLFKKRDRAETKAIHIPYRSNAHEAFWDYCEKRELGEVHGPLEWWWALAILRHRGLSAVSALLLEKLGLNEPEFAGFVVSWVNPTLDSRGRMTAETYYPPTHMRLSPPLSAGPKSSLRVDLTAKPQVTKAVVDLALGR